MKLKSIKIILGIFLLMGTIITCTKPEPDTRCTILGTVTNKTSGEPISGALVSLSPDNLSTQTGVDGKFNFEVKKPGDYSIDVSKTGFKTNTKPLAASVGKDNLAVIQLEADKALTVLPTNLDFGTIETSKSVAVSNAISGISLSWTASSTDAWITFSPNNGTLQGTNASPVQINVNRSNLNVGTYNGSIIFNASNSNSITLQVTMTIPAPGAPAITTLSAQSITQTTASLGAQLTSIGSSTVSQYGHCWSTNAGATIADAKTTMGSTSSPVNFTSILTGLTANTIYYAKAYATNSVGTTYSPEITFTTTNTPSAPTITTAQASNINLTTAEVGGSILALGSSNVTQYGHCWSTSATPTTSNSKTTLGSTSATGNYKSNLTGLVGGTKYYVRAYATNSVGTTYSDEITFTTITPTAPSITTSEASNINLTAAEVAGSITSLGTSNITQYGHCWSTSASPTTSNSKTSLGPIDQIGNFKSNLTGLSATTKYYVRAYATNGVGTTYSDEISFTTVDPIAPTVTTGVASSLNYTSFTMAGSLSDLGNSAVTEHGHCWATTANPTITNSKTSLGAKAATGNFSSNLTSLTAGTAYHVRAYATNSAGTSYGADVTVTTNAYSTPTVTTNAASNINFTLADVTGNITSIGFDNVTQYGHCWSTTADPTISNTKTQLGAATAAKSFTSNLTGITQNTTYYVRAYATNSIGTAYSAQVQFTTLAPALPGVATGTSSNIQGSSADITGNITSLGDLSITQYGHCWSTSTSPTTANSKTSLGSTTTLGTYTSNITGLTTNTTYYVRAYASNSTGTSYGSEVSFTTSPYVVTNGLVAYYNFDDGTANDWTGTYNGFLNGGVQTTTDIPNANGYAINFDGIDDYIRTVANPIYNYTQGTFSFWLKGTGYGCILAVDNTNNGGYFSLRLNTNQKIYYSPTYFNSDISTSVLNNSWHHITLTIKSYEHKLYIDGNLIEQKTSTSSGISGTSLNNGFLIGKGIAVTPLYFTGKLDNIRIFNRILSQSEVTEIYNAKQ